MSFEQFMDKGQRFGTGKHGIHRYLTIKRNYRYISTGFRDFAEIKNHHWDVWNIDIFTDKETQAIAIKINPGGRYKVNCGYFGAQITTVMPEGIYEWKEEKDGMHIFVLKRFQ